MQNLINLIMLLILSIKKKNGEISLTDIKYNQEKSKSNLSDVKKGTEVEQKSKKTLCTILKCFTKQETRLSDFLMIILQRCLKQKLKQKQEQDLKY